MKSRRVLLAASGVALALGLVLVLRERLPEAASRPLPPPLSLAKFVATADRGPAAKLPDARQATVQDTAGAQGSRRYALFAQNFPVLDQREAPPNADGSFDRVWLVDSGGDLGRLRVQEQVLRRASASEERVLRREVFVAGEIIITPTNGVSPAVLSALLSSARAVAWKPVPGTRQWVVQFAQPDLDTLPKALAEMFRHPEVIQAAEGNGVGTGGLVPNDPSFPLQYSLRNTGQTGGVSGADIRMTAAWDRITTSPSVVVAVVDSGLEFAHPDLTDNAFRDTVEIAGNGIDDDGNGFIDDVRGWDFVNNDNDPTDDHNHGSHVSGTIGARGNNGVGIAGVTWAVRILPVKVLNASNLGATSHKIAGVHYARGKGAKVMNLSLINYPYSSAMAEAVAAAEAAGILMVISAGNSGTNNDAGPNYPSSYPHLNILAVANTTSGDVLNTSSNFGATTVDLAAPGTSILSTVRGGGYQNFTGTSMAAPHVTGVAALLLALRPGATVADLRRWMLDSVDVVPALAGKSVTGGRLNAAAALLLATQAPAISTQPQSQTVVVGSSVTFSVVATGSQPLGYEWRKDGTAIGGATSASLAIASAQTSDAGSYAVAVTNPAGSVTSMAVTLTVIVPPTITTPPSNQTVNAGENATFTVVATGTAQLAYQWRRNDTAITGATAATLSLTSVQPADAGSYAVVITNSAGSVTSSGAVLTVNAPPSIATQPSSQAVTIGQPATFTVVASGMSPLSYQWHKGGAVVSGATNAALGFTAAQTGDAGNYTVVVANGLGSVTSRVVSLAVNPGASPASGTHALVGNGYIAGRTVTIASTVVYTGTLSGLDWQVLLPQGWSYAGGGGSEGDVKPAVGATDLAEWSWTIIPTSPVSFTYTLNVPAGAGGTQALAALVVPRQPGAQYQALVQPDPLTLAPLHSADTNRDARINLLELTRVIEIYNTRNGTTRTGCYKVDAPGEDGFNSEPTRASIAVVTLARYHTADSNRDGKLSLLELTRMIELYNYRSGTTRTGQYRMQGGTEDGFAPGP